METGCGSGLLSTYIEQFLLEGKDALTATDFSETQIELAKERKSSVRFQVEDNMKLSFPDKSFDAYLSNLSLMIVPDENQMLREAHRVLKDGGRLSLTVIGRQQMCMTFEIVFCALATKGIFAPESSLRQYRLGTPEALKPILETNGFTNIKMWYTPANLAFNSFEEYYGYIMQSRAGQLLEEHAATLATQEE